MFRAIFKQKRLSCFFSKKLKSALQICAASLTAIPLSARPALSAVEDAALFTTVYATGFMAMAGCLAGMALGIAYENVFGDYEYGDPKATKLATGIGALLCGAAAFVAAPADGDQAFAMVCSSGICGFVGLAAGEVLGNAWEKILYPYKHCRTIEGLTATIGLGIGLIGGIGAHMAGYGLDFEQSGQSLKFLGEVGAGFLGLVTGGLGGILSLGPKQRNRRDTAFAKGRVAMTSVLGATTGAAAVCLLG